ncbi:MAG: hypothetical protein A2Z14_12345 [Chloroflexi bacterium RBG_16_48_8]|nr:MAG: hypothetical protein A2Z14_12345 [Chloroflexi bacterium RBG_16_48_8]
MGDSQEVAGFTLDGEVKFRTTVSWETGRTVASSKEDLFAVYNDQGVWLYDGEGNLIRQMINA